MNLITLLTRGLTNPLTELPEGVEAPPQPESHLPAIDFAILSRVRFESRLTIARCPGIPELISFVLGSPLTRLWEIQNYRKYKNESLDYKTSVHLCAARAGGSLFRLTNRICTRAGE